MTKLFTIGTEGRIDEQSTLTLSKLTLAANKIYDNRKKDSQEGKINGGLIADLIKKLARATTSTLGVKEETHHGGIVELYNKSTNLKFKAGDILIHKIDKDKIFIAKLKREKYKDAGTLQSASGYSEETSRPLEKYAIILLKEGEITHVHVWEKNEKEGEGTEYWQKKFLNLNTIRTPSYNTNTLLINIEDALARLLPKDSKEPSAELKDLILVQATAHAYLKEKERKKESISKEELIQVLLAIPRDSENTPEETLKKVFERCFKGLDTQFIPDLGLRTRTRFSTFQSTAGCCINIPTNVDVEKLKSIEYDGEEGYFFPLRLMTLKK